MQRYTNVVLAVAALSSMAGSATASDAPYGEPFRPQFHYTPAKNWMNDPNGLVYYKGEYHLFYQYNPLGNEWGNMSWGHAVSPDLLHWSELPVALKAQTNANGDVTQMFFSGSAVVDERNASGLGTPATPPMVAVYTSLYPIAQTLANGKVVAANTQAQSIAYSVDRGRTWKQYAGNPVIALPPAPYADQYQNFRDPKVFWYEPGKKWVMAAVLSALHKAVFFSSRDLKNWTFMSEFGPANGVGGVWECPDLFPLPVDGNNSQQKWVLMINLNPGGPAGGSGTQYFVGDFDGTRFTAQDTIDANPPAGTLFQGFEGSSYAALGWAATGDLAGQAPASGNLPGQGGVSGFIGAKLANTFVNGDAATGTLTSPAFTITTPYIDLLVGGGDHPHDPNSTYGPPPAGTLLFPGADFEGTPGATYEQLGWTATADMAGQPVATGAIADQQPVSGFLGRGLANTFVGSTRNEGGDASQGTLTSPVFTIGHPYINFLIGGGAHPYALPNPTAVVLKVNGVVVRSATGSNNEALNWTNWNVSDLIGRQAQISIIDANTGGWGHINADQFLAADQPALPASTETAVNLVVDGQVVQSATGSNSETLTWKNWSVGGFLGRKAQIQIVDRNTGGWGHILVDDIVFSTQPKEEAHWVDYGSDFYAAVTWNGIPDNKRVAVGWMSNWNYAGNTPTSPWRNAQSLPRELALKTVNGRLVLVQQPTQGLRDLRAGPMRAIQGRAVPTGSTPLPLKGRSLEIVAEFDASNAKQFGLKLRTGANGDETLVGYDAQTGEVFVDRSKSGIVDFDPSFTTRHSAPLQSANGRVTLHVVVDASSVEVFGADGNARFELGAEAVLTDLIYPAGSSDGVSLFSVGGTANLRALRAWPLRSIWGR